MSSIINNRDATVSQLILPIGVGIKNNTNPSLLPYPAAVAADESVPGAMYIGTGSQWVNNALSPFVDYASTLITFTCSGTDQNLTGKLYMQEIGTTNVTGVYFSIQINEMITTTAAETWTAPASTIPFIFLPATSQFFPCMIHGVSGYNTSNCYLLMNTDGSIVIGISAPSGLGSTTFANFSGNYLF